MISKLFFRLNAVVRIGVMIGMIAVCGCGQKSVEMGPVETVEAFCKAVASGEWTTAESLCDTLSMSEYLTSQQETWKQLEKEDESAMAIAKAIMANTCITIQDSHKAENKRVVTFTLETDGHSKTKKATVAKVEGAWRVEGITEAN